MSDLLRLCLALLLLTAGLASYFLVFQALFGARLARTKTVVQSAPWRSFGIGMVNFIFFSVIAMVLLSIAENTGPFVRGILTIPALVILGGLAIVLSFGLASMATLIGERSFPESAPWRQTLWGTVCLVLGCALPFVGWFLLLPYAGFVGIGAVILAFLGRDKA